MTSAYDYFTVANSIVLAILAILTLIFKRESVADLFKPAEKTHATAKKASRSTTKTIHYLVSELHNKVDRLTPTNSGVTTNDSPTTNDTPPRHTFVSV